MGRPKGGYKQVRSQTSDIRHLSFHFLSDRLVDGTEQHIRFFKFRSRYAIRRYLLLLPHGSYTPAAVKEFIKLLKTSD